MADLMKGDKPLIIVRFF